MQRHNTSKQVITFSTKEGDNEQEKESDLG